MALSATKDKPGVVLRVLPQHEDIDYQRVKEVLNVGGGDSGIESVEEHEDNMLLLKFSGCLTSGGGNITAFSNAALWLSEVTVSQFARIEEMGLRADLYVGGYWGAVPQDLLREVVRLGIGLWVS